MFDAELVNNIFKQHIVSELYWLSESRNECSVFSTKSNLSVAPSGGLDGRKLRCRLVTWGVDFYAAYRENRERPSLRGLANYMRHSWFLAGRGFSAGSSCVCL